MGDADGGPGRYDVVVVGLGGMGSAAAYHLARRGLRVLGLERFTPAHALGSSHGGSRIVRQAYFEGAAYVPLLLRAYELWDELRDAAGEELCTRTGGVYVGRPDSPLVEGSRSAADAYGLPHRVLDVAELRSAYGWTARPDEVGLLEERAGFARPERTVAAHLRLAEAAGADLRFGETVDGWAAGADGVEVTAGGQRYAADRLVLTAGSWMPVLAVDLGVELVVERQVQFWFEATAPYGDGGPIFIWDDADGLQLYGFPAQEGLVKLAFYRNGGPTDPDDVDRTVHEHEVAEIVAAAETRIPGAAGKYVRGAACLYTNTPDLGFVVGLHPAYERVVVAGGFSGHGFKFVPVMGEILADLAESGSTRHPIDLFDPTRFR